MSVALIVLGAGTVTAAAIDLRIGRIPNVLTAAMALAAVSVHVFDGMATLLGALAVMLVAFGLGMIAFSAGWLGGGDVKLIAGACGLAGYPGSISLVLFVLVCGAVLALAQALARRRLVPLVMNVLAIAMSGTAARSATVLPYGVAIAGGSLAYVFATLTGLRLPQ